MSIFPFRGSHHPAIIKSAAPLAALAISFRLFLLLSSVSLPASPRRRHRKLDIIVCLD